MPHRCSDTWPSFLKSKFALVLNIYAVNAIIQRSIHNELQAACMYQNFRALHMGISSDSANKTYAVVVTAHITAQRQVKTAARFTSKLLRQLLRIIASLQAMIQKMGT